MCTPGSISTFPYGRGMFGSYVKRLASSRLYGFMRRIIGQSRQAAWVVNGPSSEPVGEIDPRSALRAQIRPMTSVSRARITKSVCVFRHAGHSPARALVRTRGDRV